MVLAGILELLFLFLDALLDFRADLRDFDLGTQDLGFFSFQGGFSLIKGVLDLFLFDFQASNNLLELVNRASTFSELVSEILDFLRQRSVFTSSAFQCFGQFVLNGLGLEEVGGQIASITLSGIQFGTQIVGLLAPIVYDLVEALLLAFKGSSIGGRAFNINLGIIKVTHQLRAGLLQASDLGLCSLVGIGQVLALLLQSAASLYTGD
jgi:hypothetical protein